jgi:hypothetical protein
MADNDSAGGFGWFLAGLGIGALVGVLYAPKSGKETREDLKAGALEAKDRANDLYEQGKSQAAAYAEQGKQVASRRRSHSSRQVSLVATRAGTCRPFVVEACGGLRDLRRQEQTRKIVACEI